MESVHDQPSTRPAFDPESPALPRWKRIVDIALSLAVMPLLAIASLGIATVMALVSPGPLLYRQERVGCRGRRFMCFRFRTMHVAAGRRNDEVLGRRPDERFIPGGWLLRASGLDELPQILNVLRGEMSLVGPRPCLPGEFALLTARQQARCRVLPGITGLWQVADRERNAVGEMVRLDLFYIENRSPGLDLKILARTLPAVLRQLRDAGGRRRELRKTANSAQA